MKKAIIGALCLAGVYVCVAGGNFVMATNEIEETAMSFAENAYRDKQCV